MMESFVVRLQFAGIRTLCEGEENRWQSFCSNVTNAVLCAVHIELHIDKDNNDTNHTIP